MFGERHENRQCAVLSFGGIFKELACHPFLCGMDYLALILYSTNGIKGSQNGVCCLYWNGSDCGRFEFVLHAA